MPDPGLRTPLLDFFRRGDVARDIRLQAAQGGMAPRAHEQIALLMLLVDDQDPDISSAANATIANLNVAQRMSLAMKGSREERAVLVRDPNKIVGAAVLSSPKLNETEVEAIAKMANVSEDILRMIAFSRAWTKSYAIVHALVRNPKTPVAMSMNFLQRLNEKDLKVLSTNRNVPEVVRVTAGKPSADELRELAELGVDVAAI